MRSLARRRARLLVSRARRCNSMAVPSAPSSRFPLREAPPGAGGVPRDGRRPVRLLYAWHGRRGRRLDRARPYPDEAAIGEALAGHLCRCTGYRKVVDAVRLAEAASGRRHERASRRERAPYRRRREGDGQLRLRQRPHGGRDALGRSSAQPLCVGRASARSTSRPPDGRSGSSRRADRRRPGSKTFGLEISDQPVLAGDGRPLRGRTGRARGGGEPGEGAPRRSQLIEVDYDELPAVYRHGGRRSTAGLAASCTTSGTCCAMSTSSTATSTVPRRTYGSRATTRRRLQDQAALGPEAGLAVPAGDGGVDLYVATQWLHVDRQQIAACLDLPEEQVRITLAGVGGAFGSREDIHMQIHACLLALQTGRPVKMAYGREESFHGHVHRHPSRTWIRYGATRDGKLVAADVRLAARRRRLRVVVARGARERVDLRRRSVRGAERPHRGHRRLHQQPAVRRDARLRRATGVLRTRVGAGRARRDARLDPVELRLRNVVAPRVGAADRSGAAGSAPVREVLERCAALPLPREPARPIRIAYPGGAGTSAAASAPPRRRLRRSASRTSPTARASTTQPRRR